MKRLIFWLVALVIISLLAVILLPALRSSHGYSGPNNKGICEVQMMRIARGMEQYKVDFGNFPTGSVFEIFRTLSENPKHKIYVEYIGHGSKSSQWNDSFVDLWGSLYKIETQGQTNVIIHSAGINQNFGDDDDMIWDGATEQLVKP